MPKYPNVGEYWYIKTHMAGNTSVGFRLAYCRGIIGENSVMQIRDDYGKWQKKSDLCFVNSENATKWEPNWFMRLLGYK